VRRSPTIKQLTLFFAALLSACSSPAPFPASPLPISTPISRSTPLNAPTLFIAETELQSFSIAGIEILSPGPDSQLRSPIQLDLRLQPGANGQVRIELVGQDGRLLLRKLLKVQDSVAQRSVALEVSLDFEIPRAVEAGRLIISTEDEYGRLQALNSVDVVLLSRGRSLISPSSGPAEKLMIIAPERGEQVQGDLIVISGRVKGPPGAPLLIELMTREGKVLAFSNVYPNYQEESDTSVFQIELGYNVKEPTWAQIAMLESGGAIPAPKYFAGIEVLLLP